MKNSYRTEAKWTTWQKLKLLFWGMLSVYVMGVLTGAILFQRMTGKDFDQARVKYLDSASQLDKAHEAYQNIPPENYLPNVQYAEKEEQSSTLQRLEQAGDMVAKFSKDFFKEDDGLVTSAPAIITEVDSSFDVTTNHAATVEALNTCFGGVLKNKGAVFMKAGKENNLSPFFLGAVGIHESGNGTSEIAHSLNNVCGIMNGGKTYRRFKSVDECIYFAARTIAKDPRYIKSNQNTIAEIHGVYCPVGAKNDPKGLNSHWTKGVVRSMNKILQKNTVLLTQTTIN